MLEVIKHKSKNGTYQIISPEADSDIFFLLQELENKETELKQSQNGWKLMYDELQQENERYKEAYSQIMNIELTQDGQKMYMNIIDIRNIIGKLVNEKS